MAPIDWLCFEGALGVTCTGNQDPNGPPVDWSGCDDAELVAGLRAGWEEAYAEVLDRFAPVLAVRAQKRGFSVGEARTLATEFLADASMRLAESVRFPLPRCGGATTGRWAVGGGRRRL